MAAHPDGTGTGWTEDIDVDQPHGLDYRSLNHLAIAVRKRIGKEHTTFADATVGGEHTPGYCQVLRQVDGTADVSTAQDNTIFQVNGLVHCSACHALWCITGTTSDPTVLLLHPDKQYKGGDVTWTGGHEFDASVDMTGGLHVDGSTELEGFTCMTNAQVDGTLDVENRADFSGAGFYGDVTIQNGLTCSSATGIDGTLNIAGACRISGDTTVTGLMSWCTNNLYDTTWVDCSIKGSYAYTHDLSSTGLLSQVWFKDTANQFGEGANRIYSIDMYRSGVGELQVGPQVHNLTTTTFTLRAAASYVAECFSTGGSYAFSTCGQYRVILMRVD